MATSSNAGDGDATATPPTMVLTRLLAALLRKNWLLKRRHVYATLSELLVPLFCILVFGLLKSLDSVLWLPDGWSTEEKNTSDNTKGSTWNFFQSQSLVSSLAGTTNLSSFAGGANGNLSARTNAPANASDALSALLNQSTWASSSSPSLLTLSMAAEALGLTIPRFDFTETTMTGLLLYLSLLALLDSPRFPQLSPDDAQACALKFALFGSTNNNEDSFYAVPSECRGTVVPFKIAIAPDTTYTRQYFAALVQQWYPRTPLVPPVRLVNLFTVPSFNDSSVFFDSEPELEKYISGATYGKDLHHPKIYAAIVFKKYPNDSQIGTVTSIEYSLRLNSTYVDPVVPGSVPRTIGRRPPPVYKTTRMLRTLHTQLYATKGFMTLQTLVARFLNCLPDWDPVGQTTSGTCQITSAVAPSSPELDKRLLDQLRQDLFVGSVFKILNTSLSVPAVKSLLPFGTLSVDTIPSASQSKLLKPLRIAPQAYNGASVGVLPVMGFRSTGFFGKIQQVFALGFVLSYLYGLSRVIVSFLNEKETRTRELMKILGVHDHLIVVSWYVVYIVVTLVASLFQTLASRWILFPNSALGFLYLLYFTFGLSTLAFGFLISSIFSRSRSGSLVGMFCFFLMYFLTASINDTSSMGQKLVLSLFSPVALDFATTILASLEADGIGLNTINAYEEVEGFRFVNTIRFLVLDFVLYTLVGFYLERVVPKEYGVQQRWNYFLRGASFKALKQSLHSLPVYGTEPTAAKNPMTPVGEWASVPLAEEEVTQPLLKQQEHNGSAVVIRNLRKEFRVPGGRKTAVKGLNLMLYEGQITCLLGHNGAGKTTLISMLTGMTAPSGGDAFIGGLSINTDMNAIRRSLGYCPQHSILYNELTVQEHLEFYARVKGFSDKHPVDSQVTKKIQEVGLEDKRAVQVHALSGGMKRRLSLAIALMGNSRVVFLDEPTSGMDPYSRRSTWELILNNRLNRVLILTTHFMDEADVLGDRIAIMANGELKCVGSSLFLKQRFGVGYKLSMVREFEACPAEKILEFVQQFVSESHLASSIGTEVLLQLPFEASCQFGELFRALETQKTAFGILSYGISVTTLEEIFLKVAEDSASTPVNVEVPAASGGALKLKYRTRLDQAEKKQVQTPYTAKAECSHADGSQESTTRRFLFHMKALLLKRMLIAKRDRNMLFFSMFLPILLMIGGFSSLKISVFARNDPMYVLSTHDYELGDRTPVPFTCTGEVLDQSHCERLVETFIDHGVPSKVETPNPAYDTSTPRIFGVTYSDPAIAPTDTTGFCLHFAKDVFDRGFGTGNATSGAPVVGQYGAFLLHHSITNHINAYNVLVNSTSTHGAAVYKAMVDQMLHRYLVQEAGHANATSNVAIQVNSHPFPLSYTTKSVFNSYLSFTAVICVVVSFTFIPASVTPFLIREKYAEQNAKHQQFVSGVSITAFWLSNFVFDMFLYLVPMVLALILLRVYAITSSLATGHVTDETSAEFCATCTRHVTSAVVLVFFLFGASIISSTYLLSHAMAEPSSALLHTVMTNFFLGIFLIVFSYAMDSFESTQSANQVLTFFWRLSPLFSLGNGLLNIVVADIVSFYGLADHAPSAFDLDIAGYELLYMLVEVPIFLFLTLHVDVNKTKGKYDIFTRRLTRLRGLTEVRAVASAGNDELVDEDVRNESIRVRSSDTGNHNELVRVVELTKEYPGGKLALSNLTFGLAKGECFGFLGVNGAGKTTTMKILTGDIFPTSGTAFLCGFDILQEPHQVRQHVGYCPQFDGILDLLTVREHLELFARLKANDWNECYVTQETDRLLRELDLSVFANKLAGSLSGGNKRKLSVAIAMIGNPKLLFLDEPSTGMDPKSRRFMWNVILNASTQSKSATIILTTHSMEECEALCSKAAIMAHGQLQCFGSIQHLKSRFGDGFLLECRLQTPPPSLVDQTKQHLLQLGVIEKDQAVIQLGKIGSICSQLRSGSSTRNFASTVTETAKKNGCIGLHEFCLWWLMEERMEAWLTFLTIQFANQEEGSLSEVSVLDRQADFSRVRVHDPHKSHQAQSTLFLCEIFERIEQNINELAIKEYSVSQTTLEQIFHSFARPKEAFVPVPDSHERRDFSP